MKETSSDFYFVLFLFFILIIAGIDKLLWTFNRIVKAEAPPFLYSENKKRIKRIINRQPLEKLEKSISQAGYYKPEIEEIYSKKLSEKIANTTIKDILSEKMLLDKDKLSKKRKQLKEKIKHLSDTELELYLLINKKPLRDLMIEEYKRRYKYKLSKEPSYSVIKKIKEDDPYINKLEREKMVKETLEEQAKQLKGEKLIDEIRKYKNTMYEPILRKERNSRLNTTHYKINIEIIY